MNAVDREFALADLLGPSLCARLSRSLDVLVGAQTSLTDTAGHIFWGEEHAPEACSAPVRLELEVLGHLTTMRGSEQALQAAAGVLMILLQQRAQYLMAADLHVEAIQADYDALLEKNLQLEQSQRKLQAFSEQLEQRVSQQVGLIEARQRQLYEAERLASVGQLAAGVAHEINNPIGFVRSNLEAARRYLSDFRQLYDAVGLGGHGELVALSERLELDYVMHDFETLMSDSVEGVDRVARIVRDLKGFSNVDGGERESVNLNDKLNVVCNMVAAQLPESVHLHRSLSEALPLVTCSVAYVNQLFMNILRNAVQAVGGNGTVSVTACAEAGDVRVEISDDGPGIAAEHLHRVFEPFYTTHEVGAGTGLGLTVARDIVKAHHGRIEIDSRPGNGCRVTVALPAETQ